MDAMRFLVLTMQDGESDAAGADSAVLGFAAVFALALATLLLVRSMVGHLRKVRYGPLPPSAQGETPTSADLGNAATPPPTPPAMSKDEPTSSNGPDSARTPPTDD